MPFTHPVPDWNAQGAEPPESLKTNGWQVGQKPPADFFNWFFYNSAKALIELQLEAINIDQKGVPDGIATLGADGKVPASQLNVSAPPDASTTVKGVVQLSNSTTSTSEALAATPKAVKDAKDGLSAQIGILSDLNTTAKGNLVNAVNELFTFANDGKTRWSNVIGSPLLSSDTFTQMQSKTQTVKNTLASNLTSKGQAAAGSEPLSSLAEKVANIQVGLRLSSGSVVLANAQPEKTFSSTTYTKLKEIKVNYAGTVRVSFMLRANNQYVPVIGRVYINGVAVGLERSNSNVYSTFTQDFNVEVGDLVQIYCRATDSTYLGYVRDFIVMAAQNPIAAITLN